MQLCLDFSFAANGSVSRDVAQAARIFMHSRSWEYTRRDEDRELSHFIMMTTGLSPTLPIPARVRLRDFTLNAKQRRLFRHNSGHTVSLIKGLDALEMNAPAHCSLRAIYQRHKGPAISLPNFADDRMIYPIGAEFYHLDVHDPHGDLLATNVFFTVGRSALGVTHYYQPHAQNSLGRFSILAPIQMLKEADICDFFHLGSYTPLDAHLSWKSALAPIELADVDELGRVKWHRFTPQDFRQKTLSPFHWRP